MDQPASVPLDSSEIPSQVVHVSPINARLNDLVSRLKSASTDAASINVTESCAAWELLATPTPVVASASLTLLEIPTTFACRQSPSPLAVLSAVPMLIVSTASWAACACATLEATATHTKAADNKSNTSAMKTLAAKEQSVARA